MNARTRLLRDAEALVNGPRNQTYGPPSDDFEVTARLWSAYLGVDVHPADVAALLILVKLRRLRMSPNRDHYDSLADIAGYAACWADVVA